MAKGWHKEPRRHSLASRGVKTAVNNPKEKAMDKKQILPNPRPSYNPAGELLKDGSGYEEVKKLPKNATYSGTGEYGTFYYDKKSDKTYIKTPTGKYFKPKYSSWSEQLDKGTPAEQKEAYKVLERRGIY